MPAPGFVHLHVHTMYSLLDGVTRLKPLMARVKELGMDSVALTDHGNLFGAIAFLKEAEASGVRPIIGCEVYLSPTTHTDRTSVEARRTNQHMVLLADGYEGYLNLAWLVSKGFLEGFYRKPRIDKELLASHSQGLIGLSGCLSGIVCDYLGLGREKEALQAADDFKQILGPDNFYLELMDNGLPEQKKANQQLLDVARKAKLPVVATNDVHYLMPGDAKTQEMLLAIGTGKTLADGNRLHFDSDEFYLRSPEEMAKLFGHVEGALSNTVAIAERCHTEIRMKQSLLPEFPPGEGFADAKAYLRHLVEEGLLRRYGQITPAIRERAEHELGIIAHMGFVSYFLVVWDFVKFALDAGIPTGCRGSGAGSIVAYALDITELDPIQSKLFFERFLNPERTSMPDFDIDICQVRRGEVINYVRKKYGDANVANIITFGTLKAKAAVRDVGRVLGMPLATVDRVAKMVPDGPKVTIKSALAESPQFKEIYATDPMIKNMVDRASKIEGAIRQPGMHAAGVVVCSKPLIEAVPLYRSPGKDEVITQFDMNEVEELGLLKIDFLGLKTLTMVADCEDLIRRNHGVEVDWKAVGFVDEAAYALLQRGDGFGVFQVESSGMREMLRRALPSNFEDIVALIALYRPGPMQFMDSFIARKHGREEITYSHPALEEPLRDTYGLMIYQEQVMQVAAVLGGFSLGQADILRRAMSKKKASEMAKMRAQFLEGCAENGVDETVAVEVYAMIEKFAQYGFNKAHAASYAVLTFRTAWLKAHYPADFIASLLTSEIRTGASDKLGMYIAVARDMGLEVLQPDINLSQAFFSVADGAVRFGLAAIKNVGQGPVEHITSARDEGGPFTSFENFCERIDTTRVNTRAIECLIVTGAFDSFRATRPQLLKILPDALEMGAGKRKLRESGQTSLFDMIEGETSGTGIDSVPLPDLPDWTDREKFAKEKELAGIFLSGHPLDRYRADIASFSDTNSATLATLDNEKTVNMVGMVTSIKEITTKTKSEQMAFVELEDFDGKYEALFFPRTFEQCREMLLPDAMLCIEGKTSRRETDDTTKVLVNKALRLEDVRRMRTKFLDIELPAARVKMEHLESLRRLLRTHAGTVAVRLRLRGEAGEEVLVLPASRFKVNLTDAFLADLAKLDFTKAVRFTER